MKDGLDIAGRIEKGGIFANKSQKATNVSPFRRQVGTSHELSNEDPTGLSHYNIKKGSTSDYKDNVQGKYSHYL